MPLRPVLHILVFASVWIASGLFATSAPFLIAEAEATTYRVRTLTVGRGTQYFRTDQSVAAPRRLTQGLNLSAYDLAGDRSGSLNAHLGIRYFSDFALEERLRRDPLFADQWNDLALDIAYLQWRPLAPLELRLGRQWSMNASGMRDFDGALLRLSASDNGGLSPYLEVYGGRDVQLGLTAWDPSSWDVQGLPPNEGGIESAPWHWTAGAQVGLRWSDAIWSEIAYGRRFRPPMDDLDFATNQKVILGEERIALAMSASPYRTLTFSTRTSYHTLLQAFDRASLMGSWRAPWGGEETRSPVLTVGVDERRPIFDSSSIFNLFGPRPHRGAFMTYQHPVEGISTVIEGRTWTRFYFDDRDGPFLGDSRAVGGALAHHSRLAIADHPIQWTSQVSHQIGGAEIAGSHQFLGESRLRIPVIWDDVYLSARGLILLSQPSHFRRDSAYALAGVLGAEIPVGDTARFSLAIETSGSSLYPINTSAFASFELEIEP